MTRRRPVGYGLALLTGAALLGLGGCDCDCLKNALGLSCEDTAATEPAATTDTTPETAPTSSESIEAPATDTLGLHEIDFELDGDARFDLIGGSPDRVLTSASR